MWDERVGKLEVAPDPSFAFSASLIVRHLRLFLLSPGQKEPDLKRRALLVKTETCVQPGGLWLCGVI